LEVLILIVIAFFVWFVLHMWSEEQKNGAMLRARDDFIARLNSRLRRQIIDEPVFANTDDELADSLKAYLDAFSRTFGFDASRNGEVALFLMALKQIERGDLSHLQTTLTKFRLDNSEELISTLNECHNALSENVAESDVLKAFLVDCNKACSDSMSEIMKMVHWSESKDGALQEVQDNVYALVLCVYRFILHHSSNSEIKYSAVRSLFDAMIENSSESTAILCNKVWPLYKFVLAEEHRSKKDGKFSRAVEDAFCE